MCTRIRCLLLQDDAHSICIATATRCYETENFQEMSPMLNVGPFFKRRYAVTSPLQAYFSDKCASKLSLEILAMQLHYTVTSLGSIIQIEYEVSFSFSSIEIGSFNRRRVCRVQINVFLHGYLPAYLVRRFQRRNSQNVSRCGTRRITCTLYSRIISSIDGVWA